MIWDVEVEVTTRGLVPVEADTYREAKAQAERPGAWLGPMVGAEIVQVESADATRVEPEPGTDDMQAWRDRQEQEQEDTRG